MSRRERKILALLCRLNERLGYKAYMRPRFHRYPNPVQGWYCTIHPLRNLPVTSRGFLGATFPVAVRTLENEFEKLERACIDANYKQ